MEFKHVPKVKHVLNHFPEYKQTADLELIKSFFPPEIYRGNSYSEWRLEALSNF